MFFLELELFLTAHYFAHVGELCGQAPALELLASLFVVLRHSVVAFERFLLKFTLKVWLMLVQNLWLFTWRL